MDDELVFSGFKKERLSLEAGGDLEIAARNFAI
jgi:hypothetical protein